MFFVLKVLSIHKDGKLKLWEQKYWDNILKQYGKEPIFKSKE